MKKYKKGYTVTGTYSSKKQLLPGLEKTIDASSKSMHLSKKHKSKYKY